MNRALRPEPVKRRKLRLRKELTRIYLRFLFQINQDNIAIRSLPKLALGLETENPCRILTEKFQQKREGHLLSVDKCQHQWQRRFQAWDSWRALACGLVLLFDGVWGVITGDGARETGKCGFE